MYIPSQPRRCRSWDQDIVQIFAGCSNNFSPVKESNTLPKRIVWTRESNFANYPPFDKAVLLKQQESDWISSRVSLILHFLENV